MGSSPSSSPGRLGAAPLRASALDIVVEDEMVGLRQRSRSRRAIELGNKLILRKPFRTALTPRNLTGYLTVSTLTWTYANHVGSKGQLS